MRRFGRGVGAVAVLMGGLAVGAPSPVWAQAVTPSLEVSPLRLDPEEVVTFTVRDCPEQPELQVGESDFVRLVEPTATAVAGTWSSELVAGLTDWTVHGACGDVTFDEVVVDIDHPLMSFLPIGAFAPEPEPPSTVYGSDCPDGTVAEVTFTFGEDRHAWTTATASIDERGDWQVPVTTADAGPVSRAPVSGPQTNTVSASCGDVTYADLTYVVEIPGPAPPPAVDGPPASPPPARPVPGRPAFTG